MGTFACPARGLLTVLLTDPLRFGDLLRERGAVIPTRQAPAAGHGETTVEEMERGVEQVRKLAEEIRRHARER